MESWPVAAADSDEELEYDDDDAGGVDEGPPGAWDVGRLPAAAAAAHTRRQLRLRMWQQLREAPADQVVRVATAFCEGVAAAVLERAVVQRWTRAFLFGHDSAHLGAARRFLGTPLSPERFQALFYTALFGPVSVELHPLQDARDANALLVTLYRRQAQASADQEMARMLAVPSPQLDARTARAAALMRRFPERFFARAHLRATAGFGGASAGEQVLLGCRFNHIMERTLPRVDLLSALIMGATLNVGLHRFRRGEERHACEQVRHCCHLAALGLRQAERQYMMAAAADDVTEVSPLMRRQSPRTSAPVAETVDAELYSRHVQQNSADFRAQLQHRVLDAVRQHLVDLESEAFVRRAAEVVLQAAAQAQAPPPPSLPPAPAPSLRASQDLEARLDPFDGAMVRDYAPAAPVQPVWSDTRMDVETEPRQD